MIVGIGNTIRSDDGVGAYVVSEIGKQHIPGVEIRLAQQLNLEFLEEAIEFEKILLVDAAFSDEGLVFRKILSDGDQPVISSHHLSPELFLYLAKRIYHKDLDLYLCSIGGKSFGLGEQFSDFVTLLAKKAVSEICAFLKGK